MGGYREAFMLAQAARQLLTSFVPAAVRSGNSPSASPRLDLCTLWVMLGYTARGPRMRNSMYSSIMSPTHAAGTGCPRMPAKTLPLYKPKATHQQAPCCCLKECCASRQAGQALRQCRTCLWIRPHAKHAPVGMSVPASATLAPVVVGGPGLVRQQAH